MRVRFAEGEEVDPGLEGADLCGNQPVRRVHDEAVLARSSGEEPASLTPSSRRRVDGVEDDAMIQHETRRKILISTQESTYGPDGVQRARPVVGVLDPPHAIISTGLLRDSPGHDG